MSYIIEVPREYATLAEAQGAAKELAEILGVAKEGGIVAVYELKSVNAGPRLSWAGRHSISRPPLFTEEERNAICDEIDLLVYVSNHVCGDGLEYDIARSQIQDMTDAQVLETLIEADYGPPFLDDDEIKEAEAAVRAAVAKHAPDKVEAAVAAWRASF